MPLALLVPGIRTSWRCRCVLPLRLASVEAGPAMRSLTWKGEAAVSEKRQSKDLLTRIAVGNMASEIDNVHDGFLSRWQYCLALFWVWFSGPSFSGITVGDSSGGRNVGSSFSATMSWDEATSVGEAGHDQSGWSEASWNTSFGTLESPFSFSCSSVRLLKTAVSLGWSRPRHPKESCVQAASNFRANQWLWLLSLHPPETAGLMIRAYKAG